MEYSTGTGYRYQIQRLKKEWVQVLDISFVKIYKENN